MRQLRPLSRNSSRMRRRFSPFLTGSDSQTEIDVTHSKQTTEKFLTGARTHIKDFETWHVIRLSRALSASHDSAFGRISARHSPISRKRRNSLKTNTRTISTRGHHSVVRIPDGSTG